MKKILSNIWHWIVIGWYSLLMLLCISAIPYMLVAAFFFTEPGKTEVIIRSVQKCNIIFTTRYDVGHSTCTLLPSFLNGVGVAGATYITGIKNVGKEEVKIAFFDRQFNEGEPISFTPSSWSHTSLSTLILSAGESLELDNISVPYNGNSTATLTYVLRHGNDPYASIYRSGMVTDFLLSDIKK
ncbi:MAG: hypothetical protein NTX91_01125 [candidate division SR1 bacterium]|nr:hypothetical protein [candidate division SR1 bacterium]